MKKNIQEQLTTKDLSQEDFWKNDFQKIVNKEVSLLLDYNDKLIGKLEGKFNNQKEFVNSNGAFWFKDFPITNIKKINSIKRSVETWAIYCSEKVKIQIIVNK